jgi:phosphotransferase system IIB component
MNLVEQITTGIEDRLAAVLTDFSPLRFYYDIEKNDYKGNTNRYGVIPQEIESQSGVTRSVTVNQTFQIVLTTDYRNDPKSDMDLQTKVKELYNKMDELTHDLVLTKVGVPSIILLITLSGYEAPEILEEHKVIALRMDLTVRYRRDL